MLYVYEDTHRQNNRDFVFILYSRMFSNVFVSVLVIVNSVDEYEYITTCTYTVFRNC